MTLLTTKHYPLLSSLLTTPPWLLAILLSLGNTSSPTPAHIFSRPTSRMPLNFHNAHVIHSVHCTKNLATNSITNYFYHLQFTSQLCTFIPSQNSFDWFHLFIQLSSFGPFTAHIQLQILWSHHSASPYLWNAFTCLLLFFLYCCHSHTFILGRYHYFHYLCTILVVAPTTFLCSLPSDQSIPSPCNVESAWE